MKHIYVYILEEGDEEIQNKRFENIYSTNKEVCFSIILAWNYPMYTFSFFFFMLSLSSHRLVTMLCFSLSCYDALFI